MSTDRGQQGGSRASILSFIGLVLVELIQKLGLSYVRRFFFVLVGENAEFAGCAKTTVSLISKR